MTLNPPTNKEQHTMPIPRTDNELMVWLNNCSTSFGSHAAALAFSEVRIDFSKGGSDGVQVECRRAGETGWQPLGTDNYSPFVDMRPPMEAGKPEVREYRLRYVLHDEPFGEWSDIVSATTKL